MIAIIVSIIINEILISISGVSLRTFEYLLVIDIGVVMIGSVIRNGVNRQQKAAKQTEILRKLRIDIVSQSEGKSWME